MVKVFSLDITTTMTNENMKDKQDDLNSENNESVNGRVQDKLLADEVQNLPPSDEKPVSKNSIQDDSANEWENIVDNSSDAWKILRYSALFPVLLVLTGVLGFYFYVQTINLIETILSMPWFLQIPLLGILILLVGAVFYGLHDFWRTYRKLNVNLQVVWSELNEVRFHKGKAAKYLKNYLDNYPIQSRKDQSEFFSQGDIDRLVNIRYRLIDKNCPDTIEGWKNRFRDEFQNHLDSASQRRIETIARITGVKTAISPYPLFDMLIVLFWSFTMIRNLCSIYNLRTGNIGTMYILCCVFTNTFIAGKLDEFESEIGKKAVEMVGKNTSVFEFIPNAMKDSAKSFAGAFVGKAATGLANYIMMKRLGYRAMRMLKPLR